MHLVIDSNSLRSEALHEYLTSSDAARVVLTDYVGIEMYKGGSLSGVRKSLEVLACFAPQVVVLLPTQRINTIDLGKSMEVEKLVDMEATEEFPGFCQALLGNALTQADLDEHVRQRTSGGRAWIEALARNADGVAGDLEKIAAKMPPGGLRALRSKSPLPPEMGTFVSDSILSMAAQFFQALPVDARPMTVDLYRNRFMFRFAVCTFVWTLGRIADGGIRGMNAEKIRNDWVDAGIAAYGTLFGGVLSSDHRLNAIHEESRFLLEHLFGVPASAS